MVSHENAIGQTAEEDAHYNIWLLLTRARYAVYRARELELLKHNLTPEQALILTLVHSSEGEITPAGLARLILLKPHTVSTMVYRMEVKGLIKTIKDPYRNNIKRITLTERGKKSYEICSKRGPIHRIMGSLTEEEFDQLQKTLNKILTKAGEELGWGLDSLPSSE